MSKENQKPKSESQEPATDSETKAPASAETPTEAPDWEAKATEYLDDLKRLQAEFDNFRKRLARDQAELAQFMIQGLVADLIPILDNFHAAITHVPETEKESPWVTGITYIEKQFEDVLKNYGVEAVEVKEGDPFDPSKHEAVSNEPKVDNQEQAQGQHVITKVVQKGYQIKDRVIRPAKVVVS